jgi:hypothetical protein
MRVGDIRVVNGNETSHMFFQGEEVMLITITLNQDKNGELYEFESIKRPSQKWWLYPKTDLL